MSDSREWQAALCRLQNCLWLLEDQGLRRMVGFKVFRQDSRNSSQYLIIVHVRADRIFSAYFKTASQADLALFRGMFMTLNVNGELGEHAEKPVITNCEVHQAFLPKFENEGQDSEIASSILAAAGERYMMVTVKHSGSLATLSHDLMGAKNSQGNIYTAVAVLLLKAHYQRVAASGHMDASILVERLLSAMKAQRLSVSFEVVSRCLSHHGQLPEGEYMVATAITRLNVDGSVEVLPLAEHLDFCIAHHLPVNDAWLFSSTSAAAAADAALDSVANAALPTAAALVSLDSVAAQHPADAIRIHGTYPHASWQGSRVEGFVIAQGGPVHTAHHQQLQQQASTLRDRTLPLPGTHGASAEVAVQPREVDASGARFAADIMQASGVARGADRLQGGSEDVKGKVAAAVDEAAPELKFLMGSWVSVPGKEQEQLMILIQAHELPLAGGVCMELPGRGAVLLSRPAVAAASADALRSLAGKDRDAQQLLDVADGSASGASRTARGAGRERKGKFTRFDINAAMQHLTGPLLRSRGLRYKKKMWSFRTASDSLPSALSPLVPAQSDAPGRGPVRGQPGGSGPAAPEANDTQGHVAYCMMTFIIRNGIRHLKEGPAAYEGYVAALVRRWGLPDEQRRRVQEFGRSWAAWARDHGHVDTLQDALYLDVAEEFVQHFLSSEGAAGPQPAYAPAPRSSRTGCGSSSGAVQGKLREAGAESSSCSDTSLTALAGHCPLPRRKHFCGLAVLRGFTDDEVREIAGAVGAAGHGRIEGAGVDLQQGWVARLGQVPRPEDTAFWEEAVPMLKIVLRPPEPVVKKPLQPSGNGGSCTSGPPEGGKASLGDVCKRLDSMSANLPSSLIQAHFREGVAENGLGWLHSRWMYTPAAARVPSTGSPKARSDDKLLSESKTCPGEDRDRKPSSSRRRRSKKHALKRDVDAPKEAGSSGALDSSGGRQAISAALATAGTPRVKVCHGTESVIAQVVAWLGDGCPRNAGPTSGDRHRTSDPQNDPAIVVVFVSTPGLGKTSICEALKGSLELSKYHVVHHHSDAQSISARKRFWPSVNSLALTRRGDGRTTVVLADKNLLDNPQGNWDKTADTINAPVLAVLLTDAETASQFNSAAGEVAAKAMAEADLASQGRGRPGAAVASGSSTSTAGPPVASISAGVDAPFSMNQLALAMLRVLRRTEHVGGLDGRLDEVLQIMCGFGSAFRGISAPAAVSHLEAAFQRAHALPVCASQSSAPPPPPDVHRDLMQLVCEGFRRGRFARGKSGYGVPASWELRMRALLQNAAVADHLDGFALPLDGIVGDLKAAVERALEAQAARGGGAAGAPQLPAVPVARAGLQPAAAPDAALMTKLLHCEYVAVGGFSHAAVADAFAGAQREAAGGDGPGQREGAVHVAKDELHITLWHRAEGPQARGLACAAAEGTPVEFAVTGFDVTATLSAARVEFPDHQAAVKQLGAAVLGVELPHITMHVGRGEKAVNARWLRRRSAAGEAGVRWLPLAEPLRLTGKVQVVPKYRRC